MERNMQRRSDEPKRSYSDISRGGVLAIALIAVVLISGIFAGVRASDNAGEIMAPGPISEPFGPVVVD